MAKINTMTKARSWVQSNCANMDSDAMARVLLAMAELIGMSSVICIDLLESEAKCEPMYEGVTIARDPEGFNSLENILENALEKLEETCAQAREAPIKLSHDDFKALVAKLRRAENVLAPVLLELQRERQSIELLMSLKVIIDAKEPR